MKKYCFTYRAKQDMIFFFKFIGATIALIMYSILMRAMADYVMEKNPNSGLTVLAFIGFAVTLSVIVIFIKRFLQKSIIEC